MSTLKGFMVCKGGKPIEMELSDEIVGGLTITDPFPVFKEADDAKDAAMSNQCRFGKEVKLQIRSVTVNIGEVRQTIVYSEGDEGDEG